MIVDSSKTGLANLIIAINAANSTALLSDTNASFGLPQVLGAMVGYRDTGVTVTPVENVDFVGAPVTFNYRRVSLDQNDLPMADDAALTAIAEKYRLHD